MVASYGSAAGVYLNPGFTLQRMDMTNAVGTASNTNFVKAYVYSLEMGLQRGALTLGLRGDYLRHAISAGSVKATLSQPGVYGTMGLRFGGALSLRPIVGIGYLVKNEVKYEGTASSDGAYAKPGLAGFGAVEIGIFPGKTRRWGLVFEGGYRFVVPDQVSLGATTLEANTSGVFARGGLSLRY